MFSIVSNSSSENTIPSRTGCKSSSASTAGQGLNADTINETKAIFSSIVSDRVLSRNSFDANGERVLINIVFHSEGP